MISLSSLVLVVVYLLIAGLISWLLWWLIGYCNVPEPFARVARVVVAVFAVLVVVGVLLHLVGVEIVRP